VSSTETAAGRAAQRIVRHKLPDRIFHWVTAASVLTLLGTAFLPIVGVEFGWVTIHWMTGLVLIAAIAFHVVRALPAWHAVWIGRADLAEASAIVRATLRMGGPAPPKPGKYSFAQKLIHLCFAVVVLTTVVTGAAMLLRIDTPWWQRNPYMLGDAAWGVIYVLHGLAALLLVTMVMTHVYFALRPEKLLYTRSMILGWITRREYDEHHDPQRWKLHR
jgi:cytochrome b subunit of formate dehydrogenase